MDVCHADARGLVRIRGYRRVMARARITDTSLREFVLRLGQDHPPIQLGSVDRTVHDPAAVVSRFGGVINYLARVELEVDRNVLELLTLLPEASETDRIFYQDIWYHQEMAHGDILDQLQRDIGMVAAEPYMEVSNEMRLLGALSRLSPIHDVVRMLYYLTGAATERQAVLAYSQFIKGLDEMGERAISETIIHPIKRQEPGHFAFYRMSAEQMVQDGLLRPWQRFLVRVLRRHSFSLVGTNGREDWRAQMGEVITALNFDDELQLYARDIGRVEQQILYAQAQGMHFPPYILEALRESVDLYRGQRGWERPGESVVLSG